MKPARIIILAVAVAAAGLAGVLAMKLAGGKSSVVQQAEAIIQKEPTVNVLVFALADDEGFAAGYAAFTNRLAAGEAFDKLARELSVDAMADAGGDYGFIVPEAVLAPALAAAVVTLKDGEISEPIALGAKRFVIFRKATEPAKALSLRDVREQIEAELHAQESERLYASWIARLREAAVIRTFDPL